MVAANYFLVFLVLFVATTFVVFVAKTLLRFVPPPGRDRAMTVR
jgi:hypothetical protein